MASNEGFSLPDNKLISVSNLRTAGIGTTDEPQSLYCRDGVKQLIDFVTTVFNNKKLGLIDGVPGTGKSSTLWYKICCIAQDKVMFWLHFDREGKVESFLRLCGTNVTPLRIPTMDQLSKIILGTAEYTMTGSPQDLLADVLVFDGVNHSNYGTIYEILKIWHNNGKWKDPPAERTGFITMSNKIQREHIHNIKNSLYLLNYHTQHSWTLQEFENALLKPDRTGGSVLFEQRKSVFETEWEIESDNTKEGRRKRTWGGQMKLASAEDIVSQKYFTAGGSARWMLQLTTLEVEDEIKKALHESSAVFDDIFDAGVTNTMYGMVSERAAQLLAEETGRGGIKSLYSQAAKLQNPAFLGWVVEADYFQRCKSQKLALHARGSNVATAFLSTSTVAFDHAALKLLRARDDVNSMQVAIMNLVPTTKDELVACKPAAWNQGGYDVVQIEKDDTKANSFHLRFGQVTKSKRHALKLKYFMEFAAFLEFALLEISSIEIGFILPEHDLEHFKLTQCQVFGKGLLGTYRVYGTSKMMWASTKEQDLVVPYGLDTSEVAYTPSF
ncbi:hypothetical protein IV203_004373 [Nitzschia inconspicua]|uniref:Uncharacterized protein n=1 Tax=Nitzschia inconspicua TaxID=303405 RepID=A0A9K3PPL8_9STRA|nr:hypothetical protein IV203_004373 [Nitzschia inconspicua]